MKNIYAILTIAIVIYILFHLTIFLYQTNLILNNNVPFDYKIKLTENEGDFIINADLNCNRYFKREIGIIFEPEYKYLGDTISLSNTIFEYDYSIVQDGKVLKKGSSHKNTLYGNVKRVVLMTYEPLDSFFCDKQKINIKIRKSKKSLDFSNNQLFFYISKPRAL